jgi:GT2 family glycosyltransferase
MDEQLTEKLPESSGWADYRATPATDEVDPWAWIDEQAPAEPEVDVSALDVTAVLVTLDAEDWLPDTLAGLARLDPPPTRLIAIDNASTDASRALLQRAHDHGILDAVSSGERDFGFGAAVAAALAADRSSSTRGEQEWLWLLHDDAVPAPDALRRLLTHVLTDSSVDVTGPKLLQPRRRRAAPRLSEVGASISGTGRRELMLDPGEVDQGQRDQPQARLGVSTCGMLVKAEVFDALGGFDPAIPVFRDGVEFGWRAHLHGYRVVTTPSARMSHRQVGRAGLRASGAAGPRPSKVDRELGMLVVAGHAPPARLPLVWLRLIWSCLLHAVGYLLGKAPGRARDEVAALFSFLTHPGRIREYRRRLRPLEVRPGAHDVVRTLRPPWWSSLRVAAEAFSGTLSDRYRSVAGDVEVASLDELTGDEFASVAEERPKYPWLSPVVIIGVLLVIASLIAARGLFGLGSLAAPSLLPAPESLGAAWGRAWDPIPGAPDQIPPPWLALIALGSSVLLGQPEWLVTLLLCGVVPLALLAVYPALRSLVVERRVRLWAAANYALLPVWLGGTNQGRLSLSVFAILLPMLVLAARSIVLRRPRVPEAWRGGWAAGVVLVGLAAFEPTIWLFALVAGIITAVRLRRTPRKIARIGLALGLPLLVLLPWLPSLIAAPGRLFVGPDAVTAPVTDPPAVWALLLGRETGAGLPPLWLGAIVFGVIWVVALIGLLRRPRRPLVVAGWVTAVLALATAIVLSRLVVAVPPVEAEARPWTGPYLLIAFAALVLAAAAGVDQLTAGIRGRSFSWVQPSAVLGAVLVALTTVVGAGWWLWAGATGPIERVRLDALPPYVRSAMVSPDRVRVLALEMDGERVAYSVLADDLNRLGDADRGFAFSGSTAARQQTEDAVLRLAAGTTDSDIAPALRDLGIGYLWVQGATEEQQSRIDNTPGLASASGNLDAVVWQLQPPATRRTTVDQQLRIGEAADPRWRAEQAGSELAPVPAGWQQGFRLAGGAGAADGSDAVVTLPTALRIWLLLQAIVLAVAAVLAAPGIRRAEVRDPTRTARRAAAVGGAGL